jgi:cell division septation protein DedD
MNLEKYICDLLYKHECVIVPGFGGFITNFEPASIEGATHTILPPRMFLVFNSSLTINDGLLATGISNIQQCSFDEAMQFIRREVTVWRERLKAGKRIMLPGIGSFTANSDFKLEFTPDPEQNFFDEAFGLTGLVIPPLQKRRRKHVARPLAYQKPARRTTPRKIRRLAWAAAITIPLVAASIWSIMNYDTLRQYAEQHSGLIYVFRPEPKTPVETFDYTVPGTSSSQEVGPENSEAPDDDFLPVEGSEPSDLDNESVAVNNETAEALPPTADEIVQPPSIQGRAYHIIIGSFENTINAQLLVDELSASGWNASLAESSQGMHRVSIASYINKQEALAQLNKIREERNPNAWLLRF